MVGQKQEAVSALGDPKKSDGTPDWDDSFLKNIHGVILIAGDSDEIIKEKKDEIDKIFSKSYNEIITVYGSRIEGALGNEQSVFICHLPYKIIKLNLVSVLVS